MKQILQNLANGATELTDAPCPRLQPGHLLIRTIRSLVSAGTERMLVEFGKANLLEKARQQPDKVRMVLDKIKTDGLLPTLDAVRSKLDQPLPLGYCNVGVVLEVGAGVDGFSIGQRVASNGKHAEVVCVPKNLCARVPDKVSDDAAAFAVLAAIGLQGVRLAQPTLGETFVVTGLGLIGLITVQILRAHGCRVLGLDYDAAKLELACRLGAETVDLGKGEDPLSAAHSFSRGRGVDGVLITAATRSNEPVSQAAKMCRKRGRIILVGVTGLELSRADFYEKELTFQVSCSYGPGRYDAAYEDRGQDYPIGFVRWTEQRNFEAVLDMLAMGSLDVTPLISHRYAIEDAGAAYELLSSNQLSLGILLEYPEPESKTDSELRRSHIQLAAATAIAAAGAPVVGFIGAGNYAGRILIPAFQKADVVLRTVATSSGVSALQYGKRYGFQEASTDTEGLVRDSRINTIVIATRHNTHARFVCEALTAGKHVFVEKPLCLTLEELAMIEQNYLAAAAGAPSPQTGDNATFNKSAPLLMVGFNRRFAPHIVKIKDLLASVKEPKAFIMTVNAGMITADNWVQDPRVGGGRIVGEACHFVDLLRFLANAPIVAFKVTPLGSSLEAVYPNDKVNISLQFADGSCGTIHYLANGHKSFPKERLEVFCVGRVLQLDNFRKLRGYGWPKFRTLNLWRQDKGQNACVAAFVKAVRNGGSSPIPFEQLLEVSRVSIELSIAANRDNGHFEFFRDENLGNNNECIS